MQLHDHNIAFGLFGDAPSAQVVLTDTPVDPRLITNAPLFQSATILDHVATWREAIDESGLNFEVEKRPLAFRRDSKSYKTISDVYATVRTDTNDALGVVKGRYSIVQNYDAGDMLDVLLDDGSAKIVAAGAWAHGALGFVVAKIPADVLIGGEPVQSFFVITWSHDGSRPVTISTRMIRPACANTFPVIVFSRAHKAGQPRFVVRHVGDTRLKVQQAREALQIGFSAASTFGADALRLLDTPMTALDALKLTEELLPTKDDPDAKAGKTIVRRNAILELFGQSENLTNVRGTAWAYVNAVAEYADHGMTARETKQTSRAENRAISTFDGQADKLKRRAMLLTREFATAA